MDPDVNREQSPARMPLHSVEQDREVAQHIDALRESERQFRALADNMSQLAWTASPPAGKSIGITSVGMRTPALRSRP
ncbi:Two-component hybrid sensor histidine kinase/response regulator [Pseudomonas amygdali pv. sesami]|nr:Two-component hybrid sensor histidine kinase/response regulator [Pseudomonas amygdali pv. sesami]KPY57087.1 Two-component hybrid sensor histidine kinase/response regulator [Pseudomonas amygdali pv. sesami]RMT87021.1 Two-component hybrid sensor histidine kinase/response regulator [Pseudomonas amygdali pv. sesami]RMT94470.1 Two-component hybrid sensor histidine kinase/response regulator [Pseudomonas amygdali pv. sesami]RMV87173.1 Two-component hybrid sensor histidine kinase/response regulator 